jgi:hypothetical protein
VRIVARITGISPVRDEDRIGDAVRKVDRAFVIGGDYRMISTPISIEIRLCFPFLIIIIIIIIIEWILLN